MSSQFSTPRRGLFARLGDIPVRIKILGTVGIVAAVSVIVGVVGITKLAANQDRMTYLYTDVLVPTADLGVVNQKLEASDNLINELTLQLDAAAMAKVTQELLANDAALDEHFAKYTSTDMTGREKARDGFAAALKEWRAVRDAELVPLAEGSKVREYLTVRSTKSDPLFDEAHKNLGDLIDIEDKAGATFLAEAESAYRGGRSLMLGLLVTGVVGALLMGTVVARMIVRPLKAVSGVATALANGDLTVRANVASRDEVGRMASELDAAADTLRETVQTMAERDNPRRLQ
ncbi:MAG: MCP four helix bundle domain-containing protein [Actinomycetota bacterium]|nr:MCP four helix bundle domain-containing protein [Actinomycetota bacterium]